MELRIRLDIEGELPEDLVSRCYTVAENLAIEIQDRSCGDVQVHGFDVDQAEITVRELQVMRHALVALSGRIRNWKQQVEREGLKLGADFDGLPHIRQALGERIALQALMRDAVNAVRRMLGEREETPTAAAKHEVEVSATAQR